MSDTNRTGTILIRRGTLLPPGLVLESEVFLPGWNVVRKLDGYALARKLHQFNWNFFYLAGEIRMTVIGRSGDAAVRKAVEQILARPKSRKYDSLEITNVVSTRFLGVPCVKVFAHSRHIQEGRYLAPARDAFLEIPAVSHVAELNLGGSEQDAMKHSVAAVSSS
jgi:hypothetical protein